MIDSSNQFQDIMAGYRTIRRRNEAILQKRKEEVRQVIPEWKTIENNIIDISTAAAEDFIKGNDGAIEELKQKISSLSQRKTELLKNAGFPADFLSPIYDCPDCRDTGYIDGEKCHCLRQKLINALYRQSNLMTVLERENFSTFRFDIFSASVLPEMQKAHDAAWEFAEEFGSHSRNLLFLGNVGSGKTFLSNCIAKRVLDKGYSVIYFSSFRLFQSLGDHMFRNEETETADSAFFQNIFDSGLLIIDDLGTESVNSFVRSQLFLILNERLLRKRSTIISSNLSLSRLKEDYSERSFSRLLDGYDLYMFKGEDLRLKPRNG